MSTASQDTWTLAGFPSTTLREEFLNQIRLLNRMEDLPRIEAEPGSCRYKVHFNCMDYLSNGLQAIVRKFRGRILRDRRPVTQLSPYEDDWP